MNGSENIAAQMRCPFDGPNSLRPEDPCPVCGDLGTFDWAADEPPSACILIADLDPKEEPK
jgi:hypothetical protein